MADSSNDLNASNNPRSEARPASRVRKVSSRCSNISNCSNNEGCLSVATKKLPPIKAPVGLAKGPDLKNCKSKIGSLHNIKHTPTSSGVTIPNQKLNWNAKSKVGSLDNKLHKPGGGTLKVESRKLEWRASSKVQSLQNVKHKPAGGNVKIFNESYANLGNKRHEPLESNQEGISTESELEREKGTFEGQLSRKLKGLKV